MAESIKKKLIHSSTTKLALQTAEAAMKPTAQAAVTASDILLTGGLAIPAEWAVKKLVKKAKGIQEAEFNHPKWGRVKITGKFRTLPNGLRVPVKIENIVVTKPSPIYLQEKRKLEMMRKIVRKYAK